MADDLIISDDDRPTPSAPDPKSDPKADGITETITVPFSADITKSRHAKILRQLANCLHALISNATRYAAVGDGANAGAAFVIHQQTYAAAMNLDAAATTLEQGQQHVLRAGLNPQGPAPPGFGRA